MKQVWDYLSGKKSTIGATAGAVLAWAQAKGHVDGDTAVMAAIILSVWTGVAVGHKAMKARGP